MRPPQFFSSGVLPLDRRRVHTSPAAPGDRASSIPPPGSIRRASRRRSSIRGGCRGVAREGSRTAPRRRSEGKPVTDRHGGGGGRGNTPGEEAAQPARGAGVGRTREHGSRGGSASGHAVSRRHAHSARRSSERRSIRDGDEGRSCVSGLDSHVTRLLRARRCRRCRAQASLGPRLDPTALPSAAHSDRSARPGLRKTA